jgi:hypothetical protein
MAIASLRQVSARTVVFSLAVALLFAMTGCGTLVTAQTAPPVNATCHSAQQCTVPVVVTCSATCAITSPVDTDNIDANGFDVVWEIVSNSGQSYTFKNPGGIFFKDSEGQQLFTCGPEMNGKKFRCHSTTKNAKPYKYGIELVGTPTVSKLDPWIVNR